jgi:iron complex outermembrane receptor protein
MPNKTSCRLAIACIAAAIAALPTAVFASEMGLEEIIVTAQKRSESAQDVPVAISAFSAEMVANTGVDTINDLIPMIPGLNGSSAGIATNAWGIRGISTNDWSAGSEPSVGVFIDGAYIGRNVLATGAFFDIAQVEVVKGPQGTLFGRNSSVGAISLTTNKPADENTFDLGLAAGSEGQREYNVVANMAGENDLAVRFAYHGTRLDGIWEDVTHNRNAFMDRDDMRLSASWTVADNIDALLTYTRSDSSSNMGGTYNPSLSTIAPGVDFPDQIAKSTEDAEAAESDGITLRLVWGLGSDMTLTSITDRRSFDYSYAQDSDGTADDATIDAVFAVGAGGSSLEFGNETKQDNISQEFRLNGNTESTDWFMGVSYFSEDIAETTRLDLIGTALGMAVLAQDLTMTKGETKALGLYGDVAWSLSDKLKLTAGVRWSDDEKTWCTKGSAGIMLVAVNTAADLCATNSWTEVTPRLVADYSVSDDVMVYASVSKGYKGGGFNTAAADFDGDFVGDAVAGFSPETNQAFELVLKSRMMDDRMQFNAALFSNDYEDLQLLSATLGGILVENAAEADTQGVELEWSYLATENLILRANMAVLDSEFTAGANNGNDLPYAPGNSGTISASYQQGAINYFVMYTEQDDFFFDADNLLKEDGYGLINAKVSYAPENAGWDIGLSVHNATDEDYAAARADIGLGAAINRGMPRLVKFEINMHL